MFDAYDESREAANQVMQSNPPRWTTPVVPKKENKETSELLARVRTYMNRQNLPSANGAARNLATPAKRRVFTLADVRLMVEEIAHEKVANKSETLRSECEARTKAVKAELEQAQLEIQRLQAREKELQDRIEFLSIQREVPTVAALTPVTVPTPEPAATVTPPAPAPVSAIVRGNRVSSIITLKKANLHLADSMDRLSKALTTSMERGKLAKIQNPPGKSPKK